MSACNLLGVYHKICSVLNTLQAKTIQENIKRIGHLLQYSLYDLTPAVPDAFDVAMVNCWRMAQLARADLDP